MKVSINIVKKLVGFELPPIDELVERINSQLGGVEDIINLGEKYKDAKIVKVVECEKHPNADKLTVCKIDAGDDELVQVVCGAPNARADMWAAWLPPKSVVPSTFDDAEPFVLATRELRGVMSHGMLASGNELGINDDQQGIIEITENDLPEGVTLTAGASFATTFGLDDVIVDIENKMFTHRPDCFGQIGVAREIAAIFDKQFASPDWYANLPSFDSADGLKIDVFNDAPEKCSRLLSVAMSGVEIRPSPLWLQCILVALGVSPVNNVVDVANYIMLMTAQPVHAYDYEKLRGQKLGVRLAEKGEKLHLLNDKTYDLAEDDIVIVDGEQAIGLGGVMGGFDSEITEQTKNIVLEVANFDMYAIRKTSMRHGIFTDAVARFNKGQSPLQGDRVMARLLQMMTELAGAKQASEVFDLSSEQVEQAKATDTLVPELTVEAQFVRDRLGMDIPKSEMAKFLVDAEFSVKGDDSDDVLKIGVPFWRTDIEQAEDIVEEVGRLYGFDKLPRELPQRSMKPAPKNPRLKVKQQVRQSLSRAGANEVLTYSFVHEKVIRNAEQDVDLAFKLSNALSPDLQCYRLTVLPSLLDKVHANIRAGHDEFVLFEIGKGHQRDLMGEDDLPVEKSFLDVVYASKNERTGAPFYRVKKLAERLMLDFGLKVNFVPIDEPINEAYATPFDQKRSVRVEIGEQLIGLVGELKQSVGQRFKLPQYVAALTIDFDKLVDLVPDSPQNYQVLSNYPVVTQDISLKTSTSVSYGELASLVDATIVGQIGKDVDFRLSPISIYQSSDDESTKTTTFRVEMVSRDRTLRNEEVQEALADVEKAVGEKFPLD